MKYLLKARYGRHTSRRLPTGPIQCTCVIFGHRGNTCVCVMRLAQHNTGLWASRESYHTSCSIFGLVQGIMRSFLMSFTVPCLWRGAVEKELCVDSRYALQKSSLSFQATSRILHLHYPWNRHRLIGLVMLSYCGHKTRGGHL